jgi:predicted thioesterase
MKVNKQQAKEILNKLSPQELALYKQLNAELGGLNEAGTRSVLRTILGNWKNYSTAMLMAIMMNANMASAINRYSPETYNAINTEIVKDTTKGTPGQRVATSTNIQQTFGSGKADVDQKALQDEVGKIQQWIQNNNGRKFKIVITAGESQVPNQSGFKQKGSLAQFRAQAVQRVLSKSINAPIDIATEIGTTPYKQGTDNPGDEKYQREQFIRVDIVVDAESVCNFNPDQPGTQGTAANGYVTFNDYISGEGTVEITPGQIPDRLTIEDSNGNIKADTGYVTTEKSKYSANWKYVPAYVLELTKVHQTKAKALTGGKIKTITVKDYEDLKSQLSARPNAPTMGDEIGPALVQLKKMVESGVTEFVIYDNMGSGTVQFSEKSGDLKATVYSPVGKTGYQLKGNCK